MFERVNNYKEVKKRTSLTDSERPQVGSKEVISQLKTLSESELIDESSEVVFENVEKLLKESDFITVTVSMFSSFK
ncbi:MAG: hypothetical protein R3B53_00425 [Candidatus Paceibacterota bacterium]